MSKIRSFRRQLRAAIGKPLAYQLLDGYGAVTSNVLERVIRGELLSEAELSEVFAFDHGDDDDGRRPQQVTAVAGPTIVPGGAPGKSVALVSMTGAALYELEYQPYCFSTLLLQQTVNALANDQDIGTIVLYVNTPGGSVVGVPEASAAVFAARQKKKVIALVNPLCASAGYHIASQATQILAVPSAEIGSIGVFMLHMDCSAAMADAGLKPTFIFAGEHKVEGNAFEPLADEARQHWQGEVDEIYEEFLATVARGRGKSVDEVRETFGKGRTMSAAKAKKVGMIDTIVTLDGAFARIGLPASARVGRRMDAAGGEPEGPAAADPGTPPPTDDGTSTEKAEASNPRRRRLALLKA